MSNEDELGEECAKCNEWFAFWDYPPGAEFLCKTCAAAEGSTDE